MPTFTKKYLGFDSLKDRSVGYTGKLPIKQRKLPERSHLVIEFPQPNDRVIRAFIPFLENPIISEKGRARLNNYDLVGRAGQLFSYGGADSRTLTVTFQITLAHLMEVGKEMDERFQQLFKVYFQEREAAKSAFSMANIKAIGSVLDDMKSTMAGTLVTAKQATQNVLSARDEAYDNTFRKDLTVIEKQDQDHSATHRKFYEKLTEGLTSDADNSNFFTEAILDFKKVLGLDGRSSEEKKKDHDKLINLFVFYINLIRSSVLNHSRNNIYGPPILRLNHGSLYNNIPCLLRSYSISVLEDAGYEVQTVTPKRVSINLELVESRTGNYGSFVAGDPINGDNLTGWESMIETSNMDPYNGIMPLDGSNGDYGVSFNKYVPPKNGG